MNDNPLPLPKVHILATGGTIAGKGSSPLLTANYEAGTIPIDELTADIPGLAHIAHIEGEQICNVPSPHITADIWLLLARRINEIFAQQPEVAGIVVTHGTDSLEETAYFLHLTVKSHKPVVLVGAMRPATALSPDGPWNLLNAIRVAASPQAANLGVLVVMNDEIYSARDVTKTHVSQLHSFRSFDLGALGSIHNGILSCYHSPLRRHTLNTEFRVDLLPTLPRVSVIYSHLDADAAAIDASVAAGARGLVLAGMGAGGGTMAQEEALARAYAKGILVVRSSRTGTGRILPSDPAHLDQGAAITADNLNPEKARVLLMLALTKTTDPHEVQRMFSTY